VIKPIISSLQHILGNPKQTLSDKERIKVLGYLLNIAIPIIIIFTIFNYSYQYFELVWVQLGALLFMLLARVMCYYNQRVYIAESLSLLSTFIILLYLVYDGGVANLGFVWGWLFPFLTFYIAGIRKGWYWCTTFFVATSCIFIFNLGVTSNYDNDTKILFFVAYVFYMVLGYRFNAIRFQYLFNLEKQVYDRTSQLQYIATHDVLTGLANRSYITDKLKQLVSQKTHNFAILNIDIDRFHAINNVLGYKNGDLLLQNFAKRLQTSVGEGSLVGRMGADEFVVILQDLSPQASRQQLESSVKNYIDTLLQAMEKPYAIDGIEVELEITLGIEIPSDYRGNVNHMIRKANFAGLTAKQLQEKFAIYDAEQDKHHVRQFHVFGGLRRALQKNELKLFYQPKIDMKSNKVTDVEALIRWISPEDGMIPPNDFIPVAESTGLIHPVTEFVLNEAMRQQNEWRKHAYHINIAVNISARNLMHDGFIALVKSCLEEHNISSSCFTLEITESAVMGQAEKAMQTIDTLKSMGFSISLDDYGTGYTSLSYLKDMPVDELKIDQSFIFNCLDSERDSAIVQSTVNLVENLGLKVVAEGIETQEVWDKLSTMGCDKAQGYFIAKPMPAEDFSQWLKSSNWHYD